MMVNSLCLILVNSGQKWPLYPHSSWIVGSGIQWALLSCKDMRQIHRLGTFGRCKTPQGGESRDWGESFVVLQTSPPYAPSQQIFRFQMNYHYCKYPFRFKYLGFRFSFRFLFWKRWSTRSWMGGSVIAHGRAVVPDSELCMRRWRRNIRHE